MDTQYTCCCTAAIAIACQHTPAYQIKKKKKMLVKITVSYLLTTCYIVCGLVTALISLPSYRSPSPGTDLWLLSRIDSDAAHCRANDVSS